MNSSLQLKSDCICPRYTQALFECTVTGTMFGATVWRGSALALCPGNETNVLHATSFLSRQMKCDGDDGSIVAQGVRIQNSHFTSRLMIDITPDMIGKTVECAYDDVMGNETKVGSLTIEKNIGPGKTVL